MWLVSLLSVSLLCALADALMPRGAVRQVGRLVCGLVVAATALSPLVRLDLEAGERWLEDYFTGLEKRETELREEVNEGVRPIIEAQYAAYIVDKAAQQGLTCSARVVCRAGENGLYLPVRVEVSGADSPQARAVLSDILQELGVPAEGQTYDEGGGAP